MPRLLLLIVVLVVAAPASAGAASSVAALPAGTTMTAGPVWAGERLVWVEDCCRVVVQEASGARRELDRWTLRSQSERAFVALAASGDRVAVFREEVTCPGLCKYMDYQRTHLELRTGSLEGPLAAVPTCNVLTVSPLLLTGRAFALDCGDDIAVRDEDLGERRFPAAAASSVALAGPWLALRSAEHIAVLDRRTGAERYGVETRGPGSLAVDEDGRIAFLDAVDRTVMIAGPEDPRPRRLDLVGSDVRLAGGRVAVARSDDGLVVADLDGRVVGEAPGLGTIAWSFDGRRVASREIPCVTAVLAVWEVGEPPPVVTKGCGRPAIRSASVDRRGRLAVRVACAADAGPAGCGGELAVQALPPRYPSLGSDAQLAQFALAAGGQTTLRLVRTRALVRRLRRTRRARLRVTASSFGAGGQVRRVVRVRG